MGLVFYRLTVRVGGEVLLQSFDEEVCSAARSWMKLSQHLTCKRFKDQAGRLPMWLLTWYNRATPSTPHPSSTAEFAPALHKSVMHPVKDRHFHSVQVSLLWLKMNHLFSTSSRPPRVLPELYNMFLLIFRNFIVSRPPPPLREEFCFFK